MQRRRSDAGFSLIELMISLVVLMVVTVEILAVFSSQQTVYVAQERVIEAQEDARLVSDVLLSDVRMAGFMIPRLVGVSSRDGGASGNDVLCASDSRVIPPASLTDAMDRFDRAALSGTLGGSDDTVQLVAAQMDIDSDGTIDFSVGQGIIVAGGTGSHCARIVQVSGPNVRFTPPTPSGFSAAVPAARAVPAVIYELNGSDLTRNAVLISNQVEDVQVEFGVDANGDGQLGAGEFPIHDLSGSDTSQIRTVRLSVITRTVSEDPLITGPGRQAVANRSAAGSGDAFRRRLMTITATPRNLL